MSRLRVTEEVESAIEEMVDKGFSCRKIAKEIKKLYNVEVSHMWIHRHYVKHRVYEKKKEPDLPRKSLTINIEDEIFSKLREQVQERKKSNVSNIINNRLDNWFENAPIEDTANQVLIALSKRSVEFKDGRRKFRKSTKTTINIRKDFLRKLEVIQDEIDENLRTDYLVRLVRPISKMTLEDRLDEWKQSGYLEKDEHKHNPFVSIAQIINIILHFELQKLI